MERTKTIKKYSELILLPTFEERFEYLKLNGSVGIDTFGFDRVLNQQFYRSREWKDVRNYVIARDNGCDLGISDRLIHERILIHHVNPINIDDISKASKYLLDPEYLICTTHITHNAIHYGDSNLLTKDPIVRKPNDTCPWKH